jgi:hypothetical protein
MWDSSPWSKKNKKMMMMRMMGVPNDVMAFSSLCFLNYKPTFCQQRLGALSYPTALLVWISGALIVNDSETKTKKSSEKNNKKIVLILLVVGFWSVCDPLT